MNDQHITAIATILQDGLLFVSAFLIGWYLVETTRLRKVAERQVEASFRPAIVLTHDGSLEHNVKLENIGSGPAMEVKWSLGNSGLTGSIPYLRPNVPKELPLQARPLYDAAGKSGADSMTATVECKYRSVSGADYSSTSVCNLDTLEFITTFRDGSPLP